MRAGRQSAKQVGVTGHESPSMLAESRALAHLCARCLSRLASRSHFGNLSLGSYRRSRLRALFEGGTGLDGRQEAPTSRLWRSRRPVNKASSVAARCFRAVFMLLPTVSCLRDIDAIILVLGRICSSPNTHSNCRDKCGNTNLYVFAITRLTRIKRDDVGLYIRKRGKR